MSHKDIIMMSYLTDTQRMAGSDNLQDCKPDMNPQGHDVGRK